MAGHGATYAMSPRFRGLALLARRMVRERGIFGVFRSGTNMLESRLLHPLRNYYQYCKYRTRRRDRAFGFSGDIYPYFYHMYNTTWKNERTVEVPIVWDAVGKNAGKHILEVGNVLSHYYRCAHDIVDKYESAPGVVNQDASDFHNGKAYDLIVSISTLEHVGWDEIPRDPEKILLTLSNLESLLVPGGRLIVTLPLGYNPEMDRMLQEGRLRFTEGHCLKRQSRDTWTEVDWDEGAHLRYNHPFPCANGLVIGIIDKPTALDVPEPLLPVPEEATFIHDCREAVAITA